MKKTKKTIITGMLICILFFSGCVAEGNSPAEADDEDQIVDLMNTISYHLDRMDVVTSLILDVDIGSATKSMLNNAIKRVDEFEKEVSAMESALGKLEAYDFNEKENVIFSYMEIIRLSKNLVGDIIEYYNYELDFLEQQTIGQKKDKIESLSDAIYNCRCGKVDCEALQKSSLEYIDESVAIFKRMKSKYGLQSFGQVIDTWTKEGEVYREFWPDLIKRSAKYEDRCWDINDEYSEFLAEMELIDEIAGNEIEDDIAAKWFVPIENTIEEMGNLGVEMDQFLMEMEE